MHIEAKGDHFTVSCSRDELSIISNALNNIPQKVSEQDYSSLIGADKERVDALLDTLVGALKQH